MLIVLLSFRWKILTATNNRSNWQLTGGTKDTRDRWGFGLGIYRNQILSHMARGIRFSSQSCPSTLPRQPPLQRSPSAKKLDWKRLRHHRFFADGNWSGWLPKDASGATA